MRQRIKYINSTIIHFNEKPLSRFLDMEESLTVNLVDWPRTKDLQWLADFAAVAYTETPRYDYSEKLEKKGHAENLLSGGAIWQGQEVLRFRVHVTGCSRIFTHQLVRARVGITYSQQCSGDQDWRHHDFVIPRCYVRYPKFMNRFKANALDAKMTYADMLDSREIYLQEARYFLPHFISTFLLFDCSANALAGLVRNRSCTMTQTWETILFARKLKSAVLAKCPWMAPLLEDLCSKGRCFFTAGAKKDNTLREVPMIAPDEDHDTYEWEASDYVHGAKTHEEIASDPTPIVPSYYLETEEVTEDYWRQRARGYGWRG